MDVVPAMPLMDARGRGMLEGRGIPLVALGAFPLDTEDADSDDAATDARSASAECKLFAIL